MQKKLILFLILTGILLAPMQVQAAPHADVQADSATFDFPNTVTFSATLSANAEIDTVTLEYGNDQLTCGEVTAKAFPEFHPGNTVNAAWTWDMRQSGSLPPGAKIWWRWRYTDLSGNEFFSQTQTVTWIDDMHDWKTVTAENLRLHYYGKSESFAKTMLDAGIEGLRRNKEQAGMLPDTPIDIYVYPNYDDMRDAVLYEPAWTGGQAYSDFGIIIMGVSGSDSAWDQNTVIHELTHILVGRNAFSCIGTRPGWLEEGLAMYSEGELDSGMQGLLDQAIRSNSLITLRSLNGGFSELPEKANLSYSQSYSVVRFLIENYGQQKMTDLLTALRDAKPIDDALLEVYGFDTDGLDSAWRESVGAAPLAIAQATAQPTPTFVPTYIPIAGIPQAITPTPQVIPTSSSGETGDPAIGPTGGYVGMPIILTIALACVCIVFVLIIGVVILGVVLRKAGTQGGRDV